MTTPPPAVPFLYNIDRIIKVKDGDTIALIVDLGFDTLRRVDVRLNGVDAPEIHAKATVERTAAQVSLRAVEDWISEHFAIGIAVESQKLDPTDKYGRVLGDLICPRSSTAPRLVAMLLSVGYVRAYDGGLRRQWMTDALAGVLSTPIGISMSLEVPPIPPKSHN